MRRLIIVLVLVLVIAPMSGCMFFEGAPQAQAQASETETSTGPETGPEVLRLSRRQVKGLVLSIRSELGATELLWERGQREYLDGYAEKVADQLGTIESHLREILPAIPEAGQDGAEKALGEISYLRSRDLGKAGDGAHASFRWAREGLGKAANSLD